MVKSIRIWSNRYGYGQIDTGMVKSPWRMAARAGLHLQLELVEGAREHVVRPGRHRPRVRRPRRDRARLPPSHPLTPRRGELKASESKILLGLQFVLESSFVSQDM
jgi:hypothetical protein